MHPLVKGWIIGALAGGGLVWVCGLVVAVVAARITHVSLLGAMDWWIVAGASVVAAGIGLMAGGTHVLNREMGRRRDG